MTYGGFWEWRADGFRQAYSAPLPPALLMGLWGIRHCRAFWRLSMAHVAFYRHKAGWSRLFREEWLAYGIVRGWA